MSRTNEPSVCLENQHEFYASFLIIEQKRISKRISHFHSSREPHYHTLNIHAAPKVEVWPISLYGCRERRSSNITNDQLRLIRKKQRETHICCTHLYQSKLS